MSETRQKTADPVDPPASPWTEIHEGRYKALEDLAERGEWSTVKSFLACADPGDAAVYRAWLLDAGHIEPADEDLAR